MGLWDWFIVRRKIPSHRRYVQPVKKWYARSNRHHPTEAEAIMWKEMKAKKLGFKFHRQAVMFGWIADFWCPKKMLIVEIDGDYHKDKKQVEWDKHRDEVMQERGIKTIRFKNADVINNIAIVVHKIRVALAERDFDNPRARVRYK